MTSLQCYNKGCGQKFNPEDNQGEVCTYHPGPPFFHDAYKGWKCCNKKVTDFTEFLNIKGCTKGLHNPVKPVEPEKADAKSDVEIVEEAEPKRPPKPPASAPRPTVAETSKALPLTVAASLQQVLTAKANAVDDKNLQNENGKSENVNDVAVGTSCKNYGCTQSYVGTKSLEEDCCFHSGVPIFHEGMKYWSCCQRKTSEFDNFLNQAGCTRGKHLWIKEVKSVACRFDWHQDPRHVYLTMYAKATLPASSLIEATSVSLKIHLEFDHGENVYDMEVPLWGAIDVEASSATLYGTKVEIKLKKIDPVAWSTLAYKSN